MSTASERRAALLVLRVRLERVAAQAFDRRCRPSEAGLQFNLRSRLLFVVAAAAQEDHERVHRLVHLGLHAYRRSSDALHGRIAALSLPDVLLDEWTDVVHRLESVLDTGGVESTESVGGR